MFTTDMHVCKMDRDKKILWAVTSLIELRQLHDYTTCPAPCSFHAFQILRLTDTKLDSAGLSSACKSRTSPLSRYIRSQQLESSERQRSAGKRTQYQFCPLFVCDWQLTVVLHRCVLGTLLLLLKSTHIIIYSLQATIVQPTGSLVLCFNIIVMIFGNCSRVFALIIRPRQRGVKTSSRAHYLFIYIVPLNLYHVGFVFFPAIAALQTAGL